MEAPWLHRHKYQILLGTYLTVTVAAFFRIAQQPYSRSIKAEQFESIFKGTTLAAVVVGVAISGRINRARSSGLERSV